MPLKRFWQRLSGRSLVGYSSDHRFVHEHIYVGMADEHVLCSGHESMNLAYTHSRIVCIGHDVHVVAMTESSSPVSGSWLGRGFGGTATCQDDEFICAGCHVHVPNSSYEPGIKFIDPIPAFSHPSYSIHADSTKLYTLTVVELFPMAFTITTLDQY